jgi:hypothetical protein
MCWFIEEQSSFSVSCKIVHWWLMIYILIYICIYVCVYVYVCVCVCVYIYIYISLSLLFSSVLCLSCYSSQSLCFWYDTAFIQNDSFFLIYFIVFILHLLLLSFQPEITCSLEGLEIRILLFHSYITLLIY